MGTEGFAGVYKSVIVFWSFKVYQNGETCETRSAFRIAEGREVFME